MKSIKNEHRYLARMEAPLREKVIVARYIPKKTKLILDVGCANGAITRELARMFPSANIVGIDLNQHFIEKAKKQAMRDNVRNVTFERIYLRDLLARRERYDVVTFVSVLHEFFSYGEGISSVLKAVADAHELLVPHGRIIIRDMIAPSYFKEMKAVDVLRKKIESQKDLKRYVASFQKRYGVADNLLAINHFLLKSLYVDNWEHEMDEDYLGVTLEEYQQIFSLLGMETVHSKTYLIPFLRDAWKQRFGLAEKELDELVSTALLVAEKK
ncbi:MAG: hypothetical protein A3C07_02740 [Candidatus Sungbacteria bacterium RIFCSPHIGHO2_02_FULL_47_11]|uniref:Methyltransferase domain-containing protein n=1 Tax=Candidatus Sungbacteria bacterium RIFCSPHIGHO2_02_FULL_47_11 TaxID=1802270 RepID=A0A1G2KIH0_9BACT|nr:MAG: hypothetical protein A3C07_02740 [Candidatus Sungbacteria bacterium RIFCSPHIGHO2_02_FULL_47_11]